MNTKLTLKLDKTTIERAKKFARSRHTSLSSLVENYFKSLEPENDKSELELSPIVQELSGIISLPDDYDAKSEYAQYLAEKYI